MQPEPLEARVEALAAEFIERRRRGECAGIEEYAARHPELAAAIRELFPTIAALESVRVQQAGPTSHRRTPAKLARLGDFRILGEIGRGGMGIVYEAVQESLGRRVAVKVLSRDTRLDDTDRKRFLREARIAGRLHHTNIVPILGVGEQDGFDFYVMQYIDGVGLDTVIAGLRRSKTDNASTARLSDWRLGDLRSTSTMHPRRAPDTRPVNGDTVEDPKAVASRRLNEKGSASGAQRQAPSLPGTFWRDVAQVGLRVAQALDYAHAQGTLHRDIKPANLLIDRHEIVWVADFGLAKGVGQEPVSRTGEILGTLNYMAPEQWQGRADARSDIYSLGVTLYELLTQKLPVLVHDRMKRLGQSSPTVAPRRICSSIPADLETIVMKAIAEEPERRYQSAGELAADFARFLEDRPIAVRRPTLGERWTRWRRRNPAAAAFSAAAAVLLLLVAVVASAGYIQTRAALKRESSERVRANEALAREQHERERAETMSTTSLETLDRVFARLVPESLDQTSARTVTADEGSALAASAQSASLQAVVSPESAALLEDLLKVYDRLAAEQDANKKLGLDAALANRRIGDINVRLGNLDRAESAYRKSLAKYEQLAAADPTGGIRLAIARLHNELGSIDARRMKPEAAQREFRRALLSLLDSATRPDERFEIARTEYLIGRDAGPGFESGPPREDPPHGHDPRGGGFGPPPVRHGPQDEQGPPDERHRRPGPHRPPVPAGGPRSESRGAGRPPKTENVDRAIALLEPLIKEDSKNPAYRFLLARCYREGTRNSALPDIGAPEKLLTALVAEQPRAADYRYVLADLYAAFDGPHVPPEEQRAAEDRLRKALEQSAALVEEHPYAADYSVLHIHILHRLGRMLQDDRPPGPREGDGPGGPRNPPEHKGPPRPGGPRDREEFGEVERHSGPGRDPDYGPESPRGSEHERRRERGPGPERRRGPEPGPEPKAGRLEEAANLMQEALRRQAALVKRFPDNIIHRSWLAKVRLSMAELTLERRNPDEAKSQLEQAVRDAEADYKTHPEVGALGDVLHDLYRRLAHALRLVDQSKAADEAEKKAEALRPNRPGDLEPDFRHDGRRPPR